MIQPATFIPSPDEKRKDGRARARADARKKHDAAMGAIEKKDLGAELSILAILNNNIVHAASRVLVRGDMR